MGNRARIILLILLILLLLGVGVTPWEKYFEKSTEFHSYEGSDIIKPSLEPYDATFEDIINSQKTNDWRK